MKAQSPIHSTPSPAFMQSSECHPTILGPTEIPYTTEYNIWYRITAKVGGREAGYLDYYLDEYNEAHIDTIRVEEPFRRFGIGTKMMKRLFKQNLKVHVGFKTGLGKLFFRKLSKELHKKRRWPDPI